MLRTTLRSLLARKLRLLLAGMAVVLGVSFTAGALTLTDTLGRVFDDLFVGVNANTDVVVRGEAAFEAVTGGETQRAPVPEELLEQVRQVPGVAGASGDVDGYAQLVDRDGEPFANVGGAPSLGVAFDGNPTTSVFDLRDGAGPGPGQVAIDASTAQDTGFAPGDTVTVLLAAGQQEFTVSGIFGIGESDSLAGASLLAFETGTAQEVLGRPGEFGSLVLAADDGVSQRDLVAAVAPTLPDGLEAVTGQQAADEDAGELQEALGFFSTFLLVFAGVALFVGAFLIFNTFTILVAQRQRELALLRALGASRGQVTRSVMVEAGAVGLVASVVGLGLGIALAVGLRALGNSTGVLPEGPLVIATRTVVASFVIGIGVTAVAALLPARRASSVPPVAAMRDAAQPERSLRGTTVIGAVLLAAGLAALAVGLQGQLAVLGIGAVVSFLGIAALSPLLSRPATRLLGAPLAFSLPGRLGRLNAMRNPRRTATTAAALMIGLALVSAVSVLGASAKTSIESVVQGALGGDLVVQQSSGFQGIPTAVADEVGALPEVAQADRLRFDQAQVGGNVDFVAATPASAIGRTVLLDAREGDLDGLRPGTVLVDEDTAADRDLAVGSTVDVTFGRGATQPYEVVGTYAPNELIGSFLFDLSVSEGFTAQTDTVVVVSADDDVPVAQLQAAVEAATAAFPTVEVLDGQQFAADSAGQIDTVLTIINVLLLLSVLIAVLGIVNTLALSVLERTRELGLLRAVGLGRAQTWRMVTVEAVLVSLFGALLGVLVGAALGTALQRALAGEGITELTFPLTNLLLFLALAAVAGVIAAVLPARRAARLDVLRALAAT